MNLENLEDLRTLNALLQRFDDHFGGSRKKMPEKARLVWLRVWRDLTAEQRNKAEEEAYFSSPFFPCPKQFKAFALGDPEEQAAEQWLIVLELLRLPPCDALPKIRQELDPVAVKALQTIGGLSHIGYQPESMLFNCQNLFVTAYKKGFNRKEPARENHSVQINGFSSLSQELLSLKSLQPNHANDSAELVNLAD